MNTLETPSSPTTRAVAEAPAPGTLLDPVLAERLIKPSRGWIAIDWRELYQSRELFDTLILRDIKIRYKQTVLGVAWAVLQPIMAMIVFTTLFRNFPGVKPEGVPFALFIFAGQVPWTFFTSAVSSSGTSLLSSQHLLTKIYFPRLYIPASNAGAYLVDLAIGLSLFGVLMPYFHYAPSWHLIFLPLVVLLNFFAAFGLGLTLASLTILFRDLRFIIPFGMQVLMFASPIFYSPEILSANMRFLVSFNPMTGIISAYRWAILGMELDTRALLISTVVTAILVTFSLYFFRRTERFFADLL